MVKSKKQATWPDVKKRCRLNQADIQMAKELGMKPKSLMKNIPSPKQQWKLPVKQWIHELYENKYGTVLKPTKKATDKKTSFQESEYITDEELPF